MKHLEDDSFEWVGAGGSAGPAFPDFRGQVAALQLLPLVAFSLPEREYLEPFFAKGRPNLHTLIYGIIVIFIGQIVRAGSHRAQVPNMEAKS